MEKIENNYSFLSKKVSLTLVIFMLFGILSFSFFDANKLYPNLQLIGTVIFIILFILVFLFSDLRLHVIDYLMSSYFEAKKVVWPEKNEVFKITMSVFLFVVFMGIFLWIVDTSLGWFVYDIILDWR
jgi:preprotein translocase subunit SecE